MNRLPVNTLRAILHEGPDAMLVYDQSGLIVLVNAQAGDLFGYRCEKLIGRHIDTVVPITGMHCGPRATGVNVVGRRGDGSEFQAEISMSTISVDEGRLVCAVVRDATARVEADKEILRVSRETERVRQEAVADRIMVEDLKDETERVRLEAEADRVRLEAQLHQSQRIESLGQLAGGIAHDFNNLLGVILNYAAFVGEELTRAATTPVGAQWEEPLKDVKQIQLAAERGARLTRQLLAFARREVVQSRAIDLNHVIQRMEDILRRTIGPQINLVVNLAVNLPMIMADTGQIEQIVLNLAINGRDAMPKGGVLTIETTVKDVEHNRNSVRLIPFGTYVSLRVGDNGVGMSGEVRAHAFEPFFTTKPRGEGSGLGLATVWGIVAQSGGYTRLFSEEGAGTSITILLPAAQSDTLADEITERVDDLESLAGTETILLTDDEDAQRAVAQRILVRNGYTVLTAASGASAIEIASSYEGPIQLLLTDVMMPVMQGPTVAKEVKNLRPDIRVLFMSGHAHPVHEAEALVDMDFLLMDKPFDERIILQSVRKVLDGHA